jgi:hypothetical protein
LSGLVPAPSEEPFVAEMPEGETMRRWMWIALAALLTTQARPIRALAEEKCAAEEAALIKAEDAWLKAAVDYVGSAETWGEAYNDLAEAIADVTTKINALTTATKECRAATTAYNSCEQATPKRDCQAELDSMHAALAKLTAAQKALSLAEYECSMADVALDNMGVASDKLKAAEKAARDKMDKARAAYNKCMGTPMEQLKSPPSEKRQQ